MHAVTCIGDHDNRANISMNSQAIYRDFGFVGAVVQLLELVTVMVTLLMGSRVIIAGKSC